MAGSKKSSPHRQEARKASRAAGERRKAERREAQENAHRENLAKGLSPWDLAMSERKKRRHVPTA